VTFLSIYHEELKKNSMMIVYKGEWVLYNDKDIKETGAEKKK
jgi:hypothetical protein